MTATEPDADVRRGLPSASALPRLSKCAASWLLSKEAARQGIVEPSNKDRDIGERMAKAMETDDLAALSDDERDLSSRMVRNRLTLLDAWKTATGESETNEYRELRLWLYDDAEEQIFSGQADVIYIGNEHALIIDEKSGRGEYESASGNAQLAGLAVLEAEQTGYRNVRVALNQPWAGPPSVADFDGPALDEAKAQLLGLLKYVETPGLSPLPGDHCVFCPARPICPALREEVTELATVAAECDDSIMPLLTGYEIGLYLRTKKRARWFFDALEAEAKRRLESNSPDAPEGWELTPGRRTRAITDAQKAFEALSAEGAIDVSEMLAACKVSIPTIEKSVASRLKLTANAAAVSVERTLGGLIEYGRTAPSLAEKKPERAQLEVAS